MNQGETIWVRDPVRGEIKRSGVLEFEKGEEVVVSFDDYQHLCVFNKSQVVDPPSNFELEVQETNYVISSAQEKAREQDWNYHRILDELGYKLVKMDCKNDTKQTS